METALARLRAKTDQELCILVARQLHRSRKFAGRRAFRDAAKTFLTAQALLAVADLPPADRTGQALGAHLFPVLESWPRGCSLG